MKILRMRAYYTPEVAASSHLVTDLDEAIASAGIHCSIITPVPTRGVSDDVRKEYGKRKIELLYDGKLKIRRFAMFREGKNAIQRAVRYLFVNVIEYFLGCREKDIDMVFGTSTPPTQGVLCALVAKYLKVPFVYNLQDVFPDSLVTTGLTRKDSLLWKIGRKIEDYTYRHADRIIVISESMKRNILEKGVPEEKIEVISNWIDVDATQPVPRDENRLFEEFGLSRDKFTVVYAGNFGAAQGAEVVLSAAELLKDREDIQFAVFGGGAGFEAAKTSVAEKGLTNVVISSLLPQERVPEVYSLGDVALITCKKGVGGSGMPSKTWSIMACGTPIIAAFDTGSELDDILRESGAGVCVEPGDVQQLATAISEFFALDEASTIRKGRMREYVLRNASKNICVVKYLDVFRACVGK